MKPLDSQMDAAGRSSTPRYNPSADEGDAGQVLTETVKGSQFKQPLLEFSGACAGCGETPYAKLITQLFGDRMYHRQRHRLLLHLGRQRTFHSLHRQQARATAPLGRTPCSRTTPSSAYGMNLAIASARQLRRAPDAVRSGHRR